MIDLSLLSSVVDAGWTDISVSANNDHGQIVGSGKLHGNTQAFLLSPFPVPEPSSYVMLLAGLGLLVFMSCRKKESAM
ncbi:MAG: PEP-CTERM sorting domain-containing protein [Nitrosomonadaceae bacterium]|nr:PEP-CTERM sorting domain-containing protein [Nitrosomonadaceae bacterium]